MSEKSIIENLMQPVLDILNSSTKDDRAKYTKQQGQLFRFSDDVFLKTNLEAGLTVEESDELKANFIRKLKANGQSLKNSDLSRYRAILRFIVTHKTNRTNSFPVTTYERVSNYKKEWAQEAVKKLNARKADSSKAAKIGASINLGHGGDEAIKNSLAALKFQQTATVAARVLDNTSVSNREALREIFVGDILNQAQTGVLRLITSYDKFSIHTNKHITSEGKLSDEYIFVLDFQDADENNKESTEEKKQSDAIKDFVKAKFKESYKDLEASPNITKSLNLTLNEAVKNSTKKAKVIVGKSAKEVKSKHSVVRKIKRQTQFNEFSLTAPKVSKNTTKVSSQPSKVNIVALLNTKLPQEIRSRMTYPRLVNRTGRFSESVQVLSADTTTKGGTSFAYTYQKDPYQLFERGRSRLATPDREPRDIIDASIRSIAQEMMLGRFYTRRV